jgi:hypothetical protein
MFSNEIFFNENATITIKMPSFIGLSLPPSFGVFFGMRG